MAITVTTIDSNIPEVELFERRDEAERALIEHYRAVWSEVGAEGHPPATWQEIAATLQTMGLLWDRHIAHIKDHSLAEYPLDLTDELPPLFLT